ncbi:hypothetical protein GGF43_006751, partial [Coemansia sp. RSA 2618]
SQELGTSVSHSSDTLDAAGNSTPSPDELHAGTQGPPPVSHPMRGRTGSLGTIQTQQMYQQQGYSPNPTTPHPRSRAVMSASVSTPYHPASVTALGNRMSKTISPTDIDDSVSDRSSISDTLSIRYQPTKTSLTANFSALTRGTSSSGGGSKYAARVGVTPVPLGEMLAKGSYKFAKIQLTLPPVTEISPVSSVYLDFEYSVDISMTIGGSFGTSKRAAGKLPLKIATVRTAAKTSNGASGDACSQVLSDPAESTRSLHDSLSCLNLSIAHSDDVLSASHKSNGSPANTLTEVHFEGPGGGGAHEGKLTNGCYPCLLSFIQNGEKIPMPELEFINIGSNL